VHRLRRREPGDQRGADRAGQPLGVGLDDDVGDRVLVPGQPRGDPVTRREAHEPASPALGRPVRRVAEFLGDLATPVTC
jgi:hypothetical protein